MSIATEITRIIEAKEDIVTSIENKGVQVTAGSRINDLPGFIDQISGGGGAAKKPLAERLDPLLYRMKRSNSNFTIYLSSMLGAWGGGSRTPQFLSDQIVYGKNNNHKGMISVYFSSTNNSTNNFAVTKNGFGDYTSLRIDGSTITNNSSTDSNVQINEIRIYNFFYDSDTVILPGTSALFTTFTNLTLLGVYISALDQPSFTVKMNPNAICSSIPYRPEVIMTDEKSTLVFTSPRTSGSPFSDFLIHMEGNYHLETGVAIGGTYGVISSASSTRVSSLWQVEGNINITDVDNTADYRFSAFPGLLDFGTIDPSVLVGSNLNSVFPVPSNFPFRVNYGEEAEVRFSGLINRNIRMQINFSKASLLNAIDALDDTFAGVITLGADNLDKLSISEKNLITSKGWSYA